MKFSFGKKMGMTQVFDGGKVVPATRLQLCADLKVKAIKTEAVDGYQAIVFAGYHTKKVGSQLLPTRIRELRVNRAVDLVVDQEISIQQYQAGDIVKVQGVSKAKGFAGVVKRHGFSGANATHGTKHTERAGGSIGSGYPEHVMKGRKMPGRAGYKHQTIKGLKIISVDVENNQLLVKGSLPGPNKGLLEIVG